MARPRPGWKPSNGFKPGNPYGGRKPKGSAGKTPAKIWQLLEQRGDRDPLDFLSEVVSSQLVDMPMRIQAAGHLAGYKHGKRPAFRYIEDVVGLKAPQTVEEAMQYQA